MGDVRCEAEGGWSQLSLPFEYARLCWQPGKCLNTGNLACGMAHLGWRLVFGIVVNEKPGGVY